ncbi:type VII secretion-associated serine protease mycosin [Micromonospora sp. URMC 103]|uniref:type VII secretion-associated serine protease mycosin n=1 Tax=Micromonospora sp. URMC 103 TaxID=3423406 RepID=UPI003F195BA0
MRESLRPEGNEATRRTGRVVRTVLCGAVSVLLASVAVPPSPAVAAPKCGPAGNPPPTETSWALRRLEPSSVWRLSRGSGVTVAVIDSGVSPNHPVLQGQVREGADFNGLPASQGQCDRVGHGTIVAGIIAGRENTTVPFTGIAPQSRILPIRVLEEERAPDDEALPGEIAKAIRWAVDHGADVINLSLVTLPRPELASAVEYALSKRVVLVAAAGNLQKDQQNYLAYPAAYPGVIAVGGMNEQGEHVGSSVSGNYVDIAGPGLNIVGPAPGGPGYLFRAEGGTSFAAAYVSGVVALVRAAHPDLTPQQVADRITRTADNPPEGHNAQIGYGMVNPYRAVTTVLGTRTNPPLGAMPVPAATPDPLGWQRAVAVWVAVAGALLAAVLLAVKPILIRGRRRGWRPGRRPTNVDSPVPN